MHCVDIECCENGSKTIVETCYVMAHTHIRTPTRMMCVTIGARKHTECMLQQLVGVHIEVVIDRTE